MIGAFSRWSSLFVSIESLAHQYPALFCYFLRFGIIGNLAIGIERHLYQNIWRTKL